MFHFLLVLKQRTLYVRSQTLAVFRGCLDFLDIVQDQQQNTAVQSMIEKSITECISICLDCMRESLEALDPNLVGELIVFKLESTRVRKS